MKAELVSTEGDQATVKISYPLLDKTVSFEMALVRRDEAWYSAEAVRQAEAELAEADATPEAAPDDRAPAAETADTAASAG